jgi:hypothetical protein
MSSSSEAKATLARQLIEGLAEGEPDQVRALFAGPADIDDPFAGRQVDGGFERLVRNWGPAKLARIESVTLDHLTEGAGGRFCGAEYSLRLIKKSGESKLLNTVAVIEMAGDKALKARLYYRRARVDGIQHIRNRVLDEPAHLEAFAPVLAQYQAALTAGDAEALARTFSIDGRFDGHGEAVDLKQGVGMGIYQGREKIREVLIQMFGIIDEEAGAGGNQRGANLEKLNIFSDGKTTIMEFNIIAPNHPTNVVHAGVSAYEIADGLICDARVYDEAW